MNMKEKNYKRTSKEAFDFMSEVKDVITEGCELFTDDATVVAYTESLGFSIRSKQDDNEISIHINFFEGGGILVNGLLNGVSIGQITLDWSDTKAVIDEAWGAFIGLSLYRDYIHLSRINGESTLHMESADALKDEFDKKIYEKMRTSFSEHVKYLRNLAGDRNYFLAVDWGYKQDWRDLWVKFIEENNSGVDSWIRRAHVWTALGYYAYESINGRFMCNDTVVNYMLPEFAWENKVIYRRTYGGKSDNVSIQENMDVVNNPVHRIGEEICELANEMKDEADSNGMITLNWDIFDDDDIKVIKRNLNDIFSFVRNFCRVYGVYVISVYITNEDLTNPNGGLHLTVIKNN